MIARALIVFQTFSERLRVRITDPQLTREQILAQGVLVLLLFFVFDKLSLPFHPHLQGVLLISSCLHIILFLMFNRLSKWVSSTFAVVSLMNTVLLGFAVHYSGGVLSPFVFVFISIIIAEAVYGIEYPTASIAAAGVYLSVILLEFFGVIPTYKIQPFDIYKSPSTTFLVATVTAAYMLNSGKTYKIIMNSLKRRLESEQEAKQTMLHELAKLEAPSQIGLVVNKIVHDIRGPLGAIGGFVDMLRDAPGLDAESRKDCEVMRAEISRISGLVNRMLVYVRPGGLPREEFCPVTLLKTVLSVASFFPEAQTIRFETNFPATTSTVLFGNKEELQQVFFNVIKNSVEAVSSVPLPRRIEIGMREAGERLEVTVADNGPGFPPVLAAKLSSDVISTKAEGGGVGLVIVREILEAYGGQLDLKAREGGGAVVRVSLPSRTAAVAAR